jgi:hypothetical protein
MKLPLGREFFKLFDMETLTWILQGVLAVVFLLAGSMKLIQTKAKVMASGGKWAEDFSPMSIKVIGAAEVLLAIGVIVPRLLGHGHVLTSASAAGIGLVMVGAFFTHFRRKEYPFLLVTGTFFLVAALVIYFRLPQM